MHDWLNWVCLVVPNLIFGASSYLQARTMYKARSSQGTSLGFLFMIVVGLAICVVLAIRTSNTWWLPVSNLITTANYIALFLYALYWSKNAQSCYQICGSLRQHCREAKPISGKDAQMLEMWLSVEEDNVRRLNQQLKERGL